MQSRLNVSIRGLSCNVNVQMGISGVEARTKENEREEKAESIPIETTIAKKSRVCLGRSSAISNLLS